MTGRISSSRILDAPADDVFSVVADISRLPEWNTAITAVIEQPDHLEPGAEWVIEMRALGHRWHSRSTVEVLNATDRCFAYTAVTDDGNPSYALWTWLIADHTNGALVTVACELHPRTFWRRTLLVRIRSRQLAHTELIHSLASLEEVVRCSTGTIPRVSTGGEQ